jgi:hypothetical protein
VIKIWVIYHKPTDYPEDYVMREHHVQFAKTKEKVITPTDHVYTAKSIWELRRRIPPGKQQVLRTEGDEPQIVEWWF